jgi:outer membrane cobalamin receptor
MSAATLVLPVLLAIGAQAAGLLLRGRVVDAQTGEPIAKALVAVRDHDLEATTDAAGRFEITGLPAGEIELLVTTVGYGLVRRPLRLSEAETEVEVRLGQEALKRSEEVTVEAAPFEGGDRAAPLEHLLSGVELRNLASVLVDDPLRSVQSLPGVAAPDDFNATFATRGSGFRSVGVHIDGVLMSAPFHTIRDVNDSFSLTVLNGDIVESLVFVSGAAPARYGDRTGAVLAVRTREGSTERFFGRASLGATGLQATVEGPLGRARKTSWLLSARKSYLDYVLSRLHDQGGIVLGFYDLTAKLAHHPSSSQSLSFTLLHGHSRWRSTDTVFASDDLHLADANTDLGLLQWRLTPSARGWLEAAAFASRETGRNRTYDDADRFRATGGQRGLRAEGLWAAGSHRVEGGGLFRHLAEDAVSRNYDRRAGSYRVSADYDAAAAQWGGFVQDTWSPLGPRLALTAGARFDRFTETGEDHLLPRGAASFALAGRTRLIAAFGRYAQFPSFEALHGEHGNASLDAERSRHWSLAVEQLFGDKLRLRAEAYAQREEDLIFTREMEWRIEGGRILSPSASAPLGNALRGRSRGIELLVQRRSANGLSGWLAYSLSHSQRTETATGQTFDSDFDQRHTFTAYASWRLRRTLNLSTKYRYGSGFPVAGFYEPSPKGPLLSSGRNLYRPEAYSRLDVRSNKTWVFTRWKLTLYGEVVNLLNRTHTRFTDLDELDSRTRRVFFETDTLLPILPTAGVTVDF